MGERLLTIRPAVNDHVADVNGVDAVDQGLVGLGHDRHSTLGKTLHEVDLPERSSTVQASRLDTRYELLELIVTARPWQR